MKVAAAIGLTALLGGVAAAQTMQGYDMSEANRNATAGALPKEGGQSAFNAISEVVDLLNADPATDWSKVSVDALRSHLVDMENVTVQARVNTVDVPGGARFEVSGDGPVRDSIRRMIKNHAAMTDSMEGHRTIVQETPDGADMTVTSDAAAGAQKIRALGLFGEMTTGVHHQLHHLMIAKGAMHH